jgi:hypothetical protein
LWIKNKYPSTKYDTFGKGLLASKGAAKQTCNTILAVNLVIDLTLFSRSLVVGSFMDTREGSIKPEYIHSFEMGHTRGVFSFLAETISPLTLFASYSSCCTLAKLGALLCIFRN